MTYSIACSRNQRNKDWAFSGGLAALVGRLILDDIQSHSFRNLLLCAIHHFDFRKHFYGRIGDFDSREEFECACWLDTQAQLGRIQYWVRNLVRREGCSFFLQKADGRFYPDFVCQLPGIDGNTGPILVVENKGGNGWTDAADDRLIGGLWANLSDGRCRFVMVRDKQWEGIDALLT